MKRIMNIAFFIAIVLQNSCIKEDPDTFGSYDIINNSDHGITVYIYMRKSNDTTYILNIGEKISDSGFARGGVGDPPPFSSDSVRVTYDDSVFIMHYRTALQTASRSILRASSWSGGKVEEYRYEWEYIFTNADYLEAVENQ